MYGSKSISPAFPALELESFEGEEQDEVLRDEEDFFFFFLSCFFLSDFLLLERPRPAASSGSWPDSAALKSSLQTVSSVSSVPSLSQIRYCLVSWEPRSFG